MLTLQIMPQRLTVCKVPDLSAPAEEPTAMEAAFQEARAEAETAAGEAAEEPQEPEAPEVF